MKTQIRNHRGFSLVEMLVVLGIVALIASISLPALKGLSKSNTLVTTQRQLLDDLGLARQLALKNRTTVYMVFVPGNIWEHAAKATNVAANQQGATIRQAFYAAAAGPYSSYALLARRRVGDQPGAEHWQFLTEWKSLPDGYVFPRVMFERQAAATYATSFPDSTNYVSLLPYTLLPVPYAFPDKTQSKKLEFSMPYIAFDGTGRVEETSRPMLLTGPQKSAAAPFGSDFVISFTSGSVFMPRNAQGQLIVPGTAGTQTEVDLVETPAPKPNPNVAQSQNINYAYVPNRIMVSTLTGRARLLKPRIQ